STTTWPPVASLAPRRPARCASRARTTSSRTATSCCSGLPTEAAPPSDRRLGPGIEEVQPFGVDRQPQLVLGLGLGGGVDGSHHGILADPNVEQDFGAQFLDHLDPGVEGQSDRITGPGDVQVLRPDTEHQLATQMCAQPLALRTWDLDLEAGIF